MLARILICGTVLGSLLFVGGCATQSDPVTGQAKASSRDGTSANGVVDSGKPIGAPLYASSAPVPPPVSTAREPQRNGVALDPIVIVQSRLSLVRKQDIPSQRDGVIQFIGVEVKPGEVEKEDVLGEFRVGEIEQGTTKQFRRLKEGDKVCAGQLLARIDDRLPVADERIKVAKLEAAKADHIAAQKIEEEMHELFKVQVALMGNGTRNSTTQEDYRRALVQWIHYQYDAMSKKEAIKVAEQELNQAKQTLGMYEIRSEIDGIVKTIYKKRGEAVKNLDPVIQIQNYDRLRVEGMVGIQYSAQLANVKEVVIEPTVRDNPEQTFTGHRLDVTSVAVTNDANDPLIVSGSDDGTVRVWDRKSHKARSALPHGAAVRAVACTPPGRSGNLCLTGDANGRGRIWDLARPTEKPLELRAQHRGAIKSVAFSSYSDTCATGGEDGQVMLWKTSSGELLYSITGHNSSVTAIHFLPNAELVTASRDNTVRLWKLGTDGAKEQTLIQRRFSDVAQLGVSPDGKLVLDEQGNEMRILSLSDGLNEGAFSNATQASKFRSFALFSPDGRLVLTTSGTDGVLQLWRFGKDRSYELRQLVVAAGERAPATCAAFAPNGTFLVGGIRDRLFVWPMPSKEEVDQQLVAQVITVEQPFDTSESKIRIIAEFANRAKRPLPPGDIVTMVAFPKR
jgi:WD40 repeat protein